MTYLAHAHRLVLDPEAVKALLINQHEKYTATLNSRTSEIERLVLLVEKLQRMLFGTKSEEVLRQIEQLTRSSTPTRAGL